MGPTERMHLARELLATVLSFAFFAYWSWLTLRWRRRARKGLVLALLVKGGAQTGLQLRERGGGALTDDCLMELEAEGLVTSRIDGVDYGMPRVCYRLREPS